MQLADLYPGGKGWQRARIDALSTPVRRMVDPGGIDAEDVFHISIPALDKWGDGQLESPSLIESKKLLLRGTEILISRLNPRKSRVIRSSTRPVPILASGEFIALEPSQSCEPRFLVWLLRSRLMTQWLDSRVRSVTRSHQRADPQALTQAQVWIPPLEEQRRIADFLDKEVSKLDELKQLKRNMADLLPRRLAATMQESIAGFPRNSKLGYVGSWLSGGTPPKAEPEHWVGQVPWASTKDMSTDELHDTADHVTDEAADLHSRVAPRGSILISTRGMSLAKRLPLAVIRRPMAFNQDLKALVPATGVEADFLRIILRAYESELLAAVVESAHGTRRLETRYLKALKVPIPEPVVQRRIAANVRNIDEQTHAANTALGRQLDLLRERRDALITAAVSGELDSASYRPSAALA